MDLTHAYVNGKLTPGNIAFYQDYGFLIAEELLSLDRVLELEQETAQIFRGNRGNIDGLIDIAAAESDEDILKKYVAIHFPHKISPLIKDFLSEKSIIDVLTKIISSNIKCMQSMLFVKGPGKAGQSWHQDEYYIPTRDKSLIGVWIAINDATVENGCLWIIPGSHKPGYIRPRIASDSNEYADVDTVDVSGYSTDQLFPVEVKRGSVVFFHGYVLHSSLRNKTDNNFRTALVNHYMSAESMLPWDQDGKHAATEDLRDILLVAGIDPYDYKGTIDVNEPYLRPEILKIKTDR